MYPQEENKDLHKIRQASSKATLADFPGSVKKFNFHMLEKHNELRALHGCEPLVIDADLVGDADGYSFELLGLHNTPLDKGLVHAN